MRTNQLQECHRVTGPLELRLFKHLTGVVLSLALCCTVVAAETTAEQAATILKPFKQNLKQALIGGLQQGPVEAINTCHLKAPQISQALSGEDIRLGRTSERLRNAANRPPRWVKPLLRSMSSGLRKPGPVVVALPQDRRGYVEPIMVQPLCLSCHGKNLPADVSARIKELYPDDQATGYEPGDFRGLFWLEVAERQH